MRTRTKGFLFIGIVIVTLASGIGIIRESRTEADLEKIQAFLRVHSQFKSLSASKIKPGYTGVYGSVKSSNDLVLLRSELKKMGIIKCSVAVEVDE